MIVCVERRFGTSKAPHLVEWLSDNGSAYIAKDTLDTATALSLQLCFTSSARRNPMESPRPSSKPSDATMLDCRSCRTPRPSSRYCRRHPAVIEAGAYAVHHPRLGEDVAAAVVLQPGSMVTEEDLRKFLSTQLALFKIPRRIVFQDKLPKGSTGKVQRKKLGDRPQ
jgi:hypothetical protein